MAFDERWSLVRGTYRSVLVSSVPGFIVVWKWLERTLKMGTKLIQCEAIITRSISLISSQHTPHSWPIRVELRFVLPISGHKCYGDCRTAIVRFMRSLPWAYGRRTMASFGVYILWVQIWPMSYIFHCYALRKIELQYGAVIARSIFSKILTKAPHSLPVRARYGEPFVYLNSDLYSTSFIASIYAAPCYIGPRYNGTRLYIRHCYNGTPS